MNKPLIPSMGGREIGPVMDRYIQAMEPGLDVVEVGAWLGAGTIELAESMQSHGQAGTLHVYDRFKASKGEVIKALGKHRYKNGIRVDNQGEPVKIKAGQDTLPIVKKFLEPYPFVKFYKGDIKRLKYTGGKIGVLVVDAIKHDPGFTALMKKFEPHLAPGAVVFLMDYWFFKYKPNSGTDCQGRYLKRSGKYEHLESYKHLCVEVVRYG